MEYYSLRRQIRVKLIRMRKLALYGAFVYVLGYTWMNARPMALLLFGLAAFAVSVLTLEPPLAALAYRFMHRGQGRLASTTLDQLSPGDFENEVARTIGVFAGPGNVRHTGMSGDGGIDVEMLDHGRVVAVIQCKHKIDPRSAVGPEVIRDMDSTKHRAGAQYAYVITNGRFTSGSRELAKQYNIGLLDGPAFELFRQKANRR